MLKRLTLVALLSVLFLGQPCLASSPWSRVAEAVGRSIAHLTDMSEEGTGHCTAFAISQRKSLYLTAAHCFGMNLALDGEIASVVFKDEATDLMVLQATGLDKPALTMAEEGPPQGTPIAALGYGFGLAFPMLRTGVVAIPEVVIPAISPDSAFMVANFGYIQGMSGGPVVDATGHVVSIVQASQPEVGVGRTLAVIRATTARYWAQ